MNINWWMLNSAAQHSILGSGTQFIKHYSSQPQSQPNNCIDIIKWPHSHTYEHTYGQRTTTRFCHKTTSHQQTERWECTRVYCIFRLFIIIFVKLFNSSHVIRIGLSHWTLYLQCTLHTALFLCFIPIFSSDDGIFIFDLCRVEQRILYYLWLWWWLLEEMVIGDIFVSINL